MEGGRVTRNIGSNWEVSKPSLARDLPTINWEMEEVWRQISPDSDQRRIMEKKLGKTVRR